MQDENRYVLSNVDLTDQRKLELCSAHYQSCWKETYKDRLPEHAMVELLKQASTEEVKSWLTGEGKRVLSCVCSDTRVIGSTASNCIGNGVNRCYVWGMYVLPRYQRAGVGRMLMDNIARNAKQSHSVAMELTVLESSIGAIEFYKSIGFVEISRQVYEITTGYELSSLTLECTI